MNTDGGIEISHATTPYIDFHYANSSADYTSRIIEQASGRLAITGNLSIGYVNDSYRLSVASFISSSWIRTLGSTGWYSETYGGGWYMSDSSWIRTYGSKNIYQNAGIFRTDGQLQVGASGIRFLVNESGDVSFGTTTTVSGCVLFRDSLVVSNVSMYFSQKNDGTGKGLYFVPADNTGMLGLYGHEDMTYKIASYKFSYDGVFYAKAGIYSDGYVSARGQNTSDIRLKTDIHDFCATDIIRRLQPKAFRWNALARSKFEVFRTDDVQYGLIAQEIERVAPWLVDRNMFSDGLWGVKYDKLIPVLLKAQQEVTFTVDDLLVRVRKLEESNARMEEENRELKRKIKILERR